MIKGKLYMLISYSNKDLKFAQNISYIKRFYIINFLAFINNYMILWIQTRVTLLQSDLQRKQSASCAFLLRLSDYFCSRRDAPLIYWRIIILEKF
jgi:hypothetical protein